MDEPNAVASQEHEIQGGQLETGFPEVGEVFSGEGSCTGTLISPSWVLTAKHCGSDTHPVTQFDTGTSFFHDFVFHAVGANFTHPDRDLRLLHLTAPITSITPSRVNGSWPAVGTRCTIVGFGLHQEDPNDPSTETADIKRSAIVEIDPNPFEWAVRWITGVGDHGDSGGPLYCSDGVTYGTAFYLRDDSPTNRFGYYERLDPTWIKNTMAGVAYGFATYVQSYAEAPSLDFGLPSSWEPIGGDFDGDGKDDYARVGATGAWLFYSNGDGSFTRGFQSYVDQAPALNFGQPSSWETITGDWNGDGKGDYARVGATGAWVFYGNADRTFTRTFQTYQDAPALNFGQPSSWETITGDWNGDGRTDYARLGNTGAWVFFGNANKTFSRGFQSYVDQSPTLDFGLPSTWEGISGDWNGDGKSDYARVGATGAWVFFGNANGSFTRTFQSYVAEAPALNFGQPSSWETITGDWNGDGRTDYARVGATGAWVFYGHADKSFGRGFQSYVDSSPVLNFGQPSTWTTITGDFDGDGKGDYARLGSTGAWIFNGLADGSFLKGFQTYDGLSFGQPSSFQVVTGKFSSGRTSYARLGGTQAFVFLHD